jgi:hypothetical protein
MILDIEQLLVGVVGFALVMALIASPLLTLSVVALLVVGSFRRDR